MKDKQIFQLYSSTPFRYVFTQGPTEATSFEMALLNGINCISLAHLVLRDIFKIKLPEHFMSSELFQDNMHFETIRHLNLMKSGDLVWFGTTNPPVKLKNFVPVYSGKELVNWKDFPVKHAAIYTGVKNDDYMMLHATSIEGSTTIWPLKKFKKFENYSKVYAIKRLKK